MSVHRLKWVFVCVCVCVFYVIYLLFTLYAPLTATQMLPHNNARIRNELGFVVGARTHRHRGHCNTLLCCVNEVK